MFQQSLLNAPAFLQVLQHPSNTSASPPQVLQHPSDVPASPQTPQHPHDKCSSVSVNALESAQILQHPHPKSSCVAPNTPKSPRTFPKGCSIPTTPSPGASTPCPAAFGGTRTQLGREGSVVRSPGSRDTATGGRCEVSLVPLSPAAVQVRQQLLSRPWPGPREGCREEGENICSQGRGKCRALGRGPHRLGWGGTSPDIAPEPQLQRGGETEARRSQKGRFGVTKPPAPGSPPAPGLEEHRPRFIARVLARRGQQGRKGRLQGARGAGTSPPPPPKDAPCHHPPAGGWSRTVDMETGKHRLSG